MSAHSGWAVCNFCQPFINLYQPILFSMNPIKFLSTSIKFLSTSYQAHPAPRSCGQRGGEGVQRREVMGGRNGVLRSHGRGKGTGMSRMTGAVVFVAWH